MAKPRSTKPKIVLDEIKITADAPDSPVSAYGGLKQDLYDKGVSAMRAMTPEGMFNEFKRTQQPYDQFKFMAEKLGPQDKLQMATMESLGYDDAVRLKNEGLMTPKAFQQYMDYSDTVSKDGLPSAEMLRTLSSVSRAKD